MPSSNLIYPKATKTARLEVNEESIQQGFIDKLKSLKYEYRADIRDDVFILIKGVPVLADNKADKGIVTTIQTLGVNAYE